MKWLLWGLLLAVAVGSSSARSLPENPCALLSVQQVAAVTGLEVTEARRVPSIPEVVRAQKEGREPDPGTICSYETRSEFGAIIVGVPPVGERSSATYWASRDSYFRQFGGSAQEVSGLGRDAWLSGGTSINVLAGENLHFSVSTQMYQPRSRELVIALARAILRALP